MLIDFIARRDSNATIEAIGALETIAHDYAELRKKSITLQIDAEFIFAGPQSDISDVLNPVYESVLHIIEDAIASKNERVVQYSIDAMGRMALHTMSIVTTGNSGQRMAPLTYGALFYFGRAARSALAANMLDATLHAITALRNILITRPLDVEMTGVAEEANETLFVIAADGYAKSNQAAVFRSVEAMLLSVKCEILKGDFEPNSLRSTLRLMLQMIPFEVAADAAGKRRLQTFPAITSDLKLAFQCFCRTSLGRRKWIKNGRRLIHLTTWGTPSISYGITIEACAKSILSRLCCING